MPNNFVRPRPVATVGILRRDAYGNNLPFIVDAWGPEVKIVRREDNMDSISTLIRWGSTASRPNRNSKIINTTKAIREVGNKAGFRKKAGDLAPKYFDTWEEVQNYDGELEAIVIRPRTHARSEHLYLCHTLDEANRAMDIINNQLDDHCYFSEYISKEKEYRVFVANGRAFMVFEKLPRDRNALSWGCVEQGQLKLVNWSEWPLHIVDNAVKAFNLSSLDFGAVDVMEKNGRAYFLEINTAPEIWPYYGQKFAQVFKYMIANQKIGYENRFPVTGTTWKHYIHPALTELAIA